MRGCAPPGLARGFAGEPAESLRGGLRQDGVQGEPPFADPVHQIRWLSGSAVLTAGTPLGPALTARLANQSRAC